MVRDFLASCIPANQAAGGAEPFRRVGAQPWIAFAFVKAGVGVVVNNAHPHPRTSRYGTRPKQSERLIGSTGAEESIGATVTSAILPQPFSLFTAVNYTRQCLGPALNCDCAVLRLLRIDE